MDASDAAAIGLALASFGVSIVSWLESHRQGRAAVRPVLVVIEKLEDKSKPDGPRLLYLVNMGPAAALNLSLELIELNAASKQSIEQEARIQTEAAPNRRILLAKGHKFDAIGHLRLKATYSDLHGIRYSTDFDGRRACPHEFGRVR